MGQHTIALSKQQLHDTTLHLHLKTLRLCQFDTSTISMNPMVLV